MNAVVTIRTHLFLLLSFIVSVQSFIYSLLSLHACELVEFLFANFLTTVNSTFQFKLVEEKILEIIFLKEEA